MERVRPVGYLKLTRTSKTHISELIRRETSVGPGGKIPFVINASSVLLYDPKMSTKELVASLDVLRQDIMLRNSEKGNKPAT